MKHLLSCALLAAFACRAFAADSSVAFNEVMYHPTNEPAMEWVELHNQMAVDIDIGGWRLDGDVAYRFADDAVIPGRGYVVIAASPALVSAQYGITNCVGPLTNLLANGSTKLKLRDNNDRLVDELEYGVSGLWPAAPNGSGVSLAKIDPGTASEPAANWTWSGNIGGSPGKTNQNLGAGSMKLVFNEQSAATNAAFWIELFNTGASPIALSGVVIESRGNTNAEYPIAGGNLGPGACLSLDAATLGFVPSSADTLFLFAPGKTNVLDALALKKSPRSRSPDGSGAWHASSALTPGGSNVVTFQRDIVINEIMFHHQRLPAVGAAPPPESGEEWVELYNRGTNTVSLAGWQLDGAVSFVFPQNAALAPGAYLVVAKDALALGMAFPAATILGNFQGDLSNEGERLVLEDAAGNPADEVPYFGGGRWPAYADGGGSSLELRDPNADNSKAEAWAASNEASKSSWQNYSYDMVANTFLAPEIYNDFVFGLLDSGECLVDEISVIHFGRRGQVQVISNGNFENGQTGWRVLGNHGGSQVIVDPENANNHVLRLVATGMQEHMHNHVEQTISESIVNGDTYRISFRAKWLAGSPLLNTRLYFNRAARTTALPVPMLNGTPGAVNSRFETNIGPTFSQFGHSPVVPAAGQSVIVSVRAQDPQGVTGATLFWSTNGTSFNQVAMNTNSAGMYAGVIPGMPAGRLVQFYVRAQDGLGVQVMFPAKGPQSGALYKVADGLERMDLGHNFRIVMTQPNWGLLRAATNLLSNGGLPCTIIYDERRPYYDVRVRLKGSMMGRANDARPSFNVHFPPDDLFRGVHPVLLLDCSGRTDSQEEIIVHHLALKAGGIPKPRGDIGWVVTPMETPAGATVAVPRYEDRFIEDSFEKGGDGTAWLFELIYWGTATTSGGYKLPQGIQIMGYDLRSMGDNKEDYRYYHLLKNHHDADDYSKLIPMLEAFDLPYGPVLEAQAERVLDVNQWLRTFAFVSLWGDGDFYTFSAAHNLILYLRPSDKRMMVFPSDVEQLYNLPPTAPLIPTGAEYWNDIANQPGNRRRLYAHALDIIAKAYNTAYMTRWLNHYGAVAGGQDYSGFLTYAPDRIQAVNSEIAAAGGNAPFAISGPAYRATGTNLLVLSGTAPVALQSITVNGLAYAVTWSSVSDWTLTVPLNVGTNVLQIAGRDLYGNVLTNFSGTVTANYTGPAPDSSRDIVFSEICYTSAAPDAEFVEIQNRSSSISYDLSNWRVNGLDYVFPPGSVITNGQRLVLAADPGALINAYGSNLVPYAIYAGRLQTNGELLSLLAPLNSNAAPVVIDRVRYGAKAPWPIPAPGASLQLVDAAQENARVGNWAAAAATPGQPNGPATVLPTFPNLWINEVQAENLSGLTNSAGTPVPWIEIFNPSTNTVSLQGLFLSRNYTNLTAWAFPTGAVVNPRQFKIVYADGLTNLSTTNELHANFTLSPGWGSVALSRLYSSQPQVLDYVDYTNLPPNRSYGSLPDGQCFDRTEFFLPTPGATNNSQASPVTVVINEWMAANTAGLRNPLSGKFSDWFELFNYGTNAVHLGGLYLTDTPTNKFKFQIPQGYVIQPGGFLIAFADERNTNGTPELHVNFKMSRSGESLGLFTLDGQVVDFLNYGPQADNISEGRFPDGDLATFFMPDSTPGASNRLPNTAPMVNPLPTLVVYRGQTARATVTASDAESAFQTLQFSVLPGGAAGATIAPTTGIFTWTTAATEAPSTNQFAIRVTDSGTPPLSGDGSLGVVVLPEPTLSAARSGSTVTLSFGTVPGETYQLEFKEHLQDPFWTPLEVPFVGTGAPVQIQDTPAAGSQRYYRLGVLP